MLGTIARNHGSLISSEDISTMTNTFQDFSDRRNVCLRYLDKKSENPVTGSDGPIGSPILLVSSRSLQLCTRSPRPKWCGTTPTNPPSPGRSTAWCLVLQRCSRPVGDPPWSVPVATTSAKDKMLKQKVTGKAYSSTSYNRLLDLHMVGIMPSLGSSSSTMEMAHLFIRASLLMMVSTQSPVMSLCFLQNLQMISRWEYVFVMSDEELIQPFQIFH